MSAERLVASTRSLLRFLTDCARKVQAWRERCRVFIDDDVREARGMTLLREWLSPQQQAQFKEFGWFEVIGYDTGKRYRILYGATTNVHELDGDGRTHIGWCFVPKGYLVPGDVMLAQKIALETNERAALAVANRFPFVGDDQRSQARLVGMREPRNCGDSAGLHPLITR
jgi:hypothetical protein